MRILVVLVAALLAFPVAALACSIDGNPPAVFTSQRGAKATKPPKEPSAALLSITRGGDMPESCSDIGFLIVGIKPDPDVYAFIFEVVEGSAPSEAFLPGPVLGLRTPDGLTFAFSWVETRPAPLDFTLRVTPLSRAGVAGGASLLRVQEKGR